MIGIDLDPHHGGPEVGRGRVLEHLERRRLEQHGDLGASPGHALAGADVERHPGPAPVLDVELQGDVGLGDRILRDVRLVPVGGHVAPLRGAGRILAAHRVLRRDRLHGLGELGLLGAHGLRVEGVRRLHGDHAEQLEHVVRHHVAQRPGRLVEAAPLLDADGLGRRDLDAVDVFPPPDRLQQAVGEAERHDRLNGLLTQEVVDPVELALVALAKDAGVQLPGRGQIGAERLLDDDAAERSALLLQQAGLPEPVHDRPEEARRHRAVEHRAAGDPLLHGRVGLGLLEIALQVVEPVPDETPALRVDVVGVELRGRVLAERLQGLGEILAERLVGTVIVIDAEDREALGQEARPREVVERGHQQALGQVAAGPEDHQRAGRRRLRAAGCRVLEGCRRLGHP